MAKKLQHIAIIMDGNGRWAKSRNLIRTKGHLEGTKTLENIMELCIKNKIPYLTVYAFSTENWHRPKKEVNFLMHHLQKYLKKRLNEFMKNGIRLNIFGDLKKNVPPTLSKDIKNAIKETQKNSTLNLNIAFNYGGRDEIIRAIKKMNKKEKKWFSNLTEEKFAEFLDNPHVPEPDLMIRTGGEVRISNFLLWEISYSELYFTKTLWPDFDEKEFKKALRYYYKKNRRYGGLNS